MEKDKILFGVLIGLLLAVAILVAGCGVYGSNSKEAAYKCEVRSNLDFVYSGIAASTCPSRRLSGTNAQKKEQCEAPVAYTEGPKTERVLMCIWTGPAQ